MESGDLFRVETVEATEPPGEVTSGTWCRYVIANRRSRVVGRFRGNLSEARRNAEHLAKSINGRAGNGLTIWTSRAKPRRKAVAVAARA